MTYEATSSRRSGRALPIALTEETQRPALPTEIRTTTPPTDPTDPTAEPTAPPTTPAAPSLSAAPPAVAPLQGSAEVFGTQVSRRETGAAMEAARLTLIWRRFPFGGAGRGGLLDTLRRGIGNFAGQVAAGLS